MIIKTLELQNFRNYKEASIVFDSGTNILYGENAQGKTNILESIFVSATTKSHKGSKDSEIIGFGQEEAHIRTTLFKDIYETRVDMHLRNHGSKIIAIDKKKIKKASELMGLLNVVFFSPEDLSIIKGGPSGRRRFVDMELCQLDATYLSDLSNYQKAVNQRNKLLKDMQRDSSLISTLDVWDMQLASYGDRIIKRRASFVDTLNSIIFDIHKRLSGGREEIFISYAPDSPEGEIEASLKNCREKDLRLKQTGAGPHRDDFIFSVGGMDLRKFGSQGQQRTGALSLKLAEISLVESLSGEKPLLLLDDVLSELDSGRQEYLLQSIHDIQTIITCTGLDEFVKNQFKINKVFYVKDGTVGDYVL